MKQPKTYIDRRFDLIVLFPYVYFGTVIIASLFFFLATWQSNTISISSKYVTSGLLTIAIGIVTLFFMANNE